MKKSHGGKRPGAGRKPGGQNAATIEKQVLRERLRAKVAAELDPLIEAQIANAKGIKYLVVRDRKTGKFLRIGEIGAGKLKPDEEIIEVWEKDPSVFAFTDLMNRTVDKPVEPVEIEHSGDLTIRWAS